MDINWGDVFGAVGSKAISIGVILLLLAVGLRLSSRLIDRIVERRALVSKIGIESREDEQRTQTIRRVLTTSVRVLLIFIAVVMILGVLGVNTAALIAGAGIAGVALGFGVQYLVQDYTTGTLIILENQYRVGDVVTVGNVSGVVEDINLRVTTIRDLDGTVHHVPNGEIRIASNLSKDFSRVNLDVGIGYESDLEHVIDVVNRVGNEMFEDPEWSELMISAPQFLRVNNFGDSSIDIKIVGDTKALHQWAVTGELRKRLKIEFDREGIEIPFPQRVVHGLPKT